MTDTGLEMQVHGDVYYGNLLSQWQSVFLREFSQKVHELVDFFPTTRSLEISYSDLDLANSELATAFLTDPDTVLNAGIKALRATNPMSFPTEEDLHIRITHFPNDFKVPISGIRKINLGSPIAVEGIIRKATMPKPYITVGVFQCRICGHMVNVVQDDGHKYLEPTSCPSDEGGCGKATPKHFKLLYKKTEYEDNQKIEIQEAPDAIKSGTQPASIIAYLHDDIVGSVSAGNRVTLNGILRAEHNPHTQSPLCELHLDVISIESQQDVYEDIEITSEDEEKILEISRSPTLFRDLTASVAPTIYGYDVEKMALVLQLFGGVPKQLEDGTRIRGDFHILLVGDPGVAKSQMLHYITKLSPRGIYASGKASTAAGLCATAVKDEFGEGRWSLEAGALVLADKGNACIDELDKMSDQDRSSLHEAMESQMVTIAKAGINAQLNTRCSLLGAANPKYGRFEEHISYAEQIDMPPALVSRFDLIFVLLDKPDKEKDKCTAMQIINTHRRGAARVQTEVLDGVDVDKILNDTKQLMPVYDRQTLRKYIAYAKNFNPVLTDDAANMIADAYQSLRYKTDGKSVPITARQMEAYIRLAEASARARLSKTVSEEDAQRALDLVEYYLQKVAGHDGQIDIDAIFTLQSKETRDHAKTIEEIIRNLGRTFTRDDLLESALEQGISEHAASQTLGMMCKQKKIRSRGEGIYENLR